VPNTFIASVNSIYKTSMVKDLIVDGCKILIFSNPRRTARIVDLDILKYLTNHSGETGDRAVILGDLRIDFVALEFKSGHLNASKVGEQLQGSAVQLSSLANGQTVSGFLPICVYPKRVKATALKVFLKARSKCKIEFRGQLFQPNVACCGSKLAMVINSSGRLLALNS